MPEIPTVEIHSPKDVSQKWIINASDYNPGQHALWGGLVEQDAINVPASEPEHQGMRPSVPDYVHDDDGNIVAVNIIDPERRTARKEIPYGDYNPDEHELWSEHPRFH